MGGDLFEPPPGASRFEQWTDAGLSFVWRWFWKIVFWSVVAVVVVVGGILLIGWMSNREPAGISTWALALAGGALGILWHCARLLQTIVNQNDQIISHLRDRRHN